MWRGVVFYWEKGGPINLLIFLVCFVVVFIGLSKMRQFRSYGRLRARLNQLLERSENVAGGLATSDEWFVRRLSATAGSGAHPASFYRNRLREVLLEVVPQLESGLDTMAAWIAVAPLLGLLGTVLGMIRTFSIIMVFGVGNPNLLSEGISVSLLTTQAGLLVAFPCLLFHNALCDRKNALVKMLMVEGERLTAACAGEREHA